MNIDCCLLKSRATMTAQWGLPVPFRVKLRCFLQSNTFFTVLTQVVPICPVCAPDTEERAILKPDIVFFGEGLPNHFYDHLDNDKEDADLLIVMGSSLKVRPVATIPSECKDLFDFWCGVIIKRKSDHVRMTICVKEDQLIMLVYCADGDIPKSVESACCSVKLHSSFQGLRYKVILKL